MDCAHTAAALSGAVAFSGANSPFSCSSCNFTCMPSTASLAKLAMTKPNRGWNHLHSKVSTANECNNLFANSHAKSTALEKWYLCRLENHLYHLTSSMSVLYVTMTMSLAPGFWRNVTVSVLSWNLEMPKKTTRLGVSTSSS